MNVPNCRYLEVPVNNDFTAQELGYIVTGILKQVLFQRDQMPMPYDILDCHLRSGRRLPNVERLTLLRNQLSSVFDSLDQAFTVSSFLLDQVVLLLGSTRFNAREMHTITVPGHSSKFRRVLRTFRTEELNATLRKILEADVCCNFPPSDITSVHLFLRGCPLDMDNSLLDHFEPLMRFVPQVSPRFYKSIFDLKFAGQGRLTKRSTFQRSGSHLNVRRKSDIERAEREEIRKNLFVESDTCRVVEQDLQEEDDGGIDDDGTSDSSNGEESSDDPDTSSELENSSEDSIVENSIDGPQPLVWYRSKIPISGWVPH
ncbi:hypothetical protein RvY_01425 [Ramazzottius varieornatus]|uniref:Uncharacterized protein n=1 Tax=Ramazzottius varieornatus TaxID=947166 RepID=A0A1D1UG95_RAMVA|nr:hypothetical protein RvY_01425 [Ramazzottius varieornatus]